MIKQDISENRAKFVYLGIGSNLGNKKRNIEKAKFQIEKNNIKIESCSSFYESDSWPNSNFPKYFNIVLKAKTFFKPHNLLKKIKEIEILIGRKLSFKNHPRICDIDIIDYDQKVLKINNLDPALIRDRVAFEHKTPLFPDEKFKIRNQFERFHNLPETEKQSLRNAYEDFKSLSPEKQKSLLTQHSKTTG